jgi:EAL domain-containing protein (putative c-di-GMP-specific phosphodiesterase class I)/FixJ family two-component response regulator
MSIALDAYLYCNRHASNQLAAELHSAGVSDLSEKHDKEIPGSQTHVVDREQAVQIDDHSTTYRELVSAIDGDQFRVHYQPIADLQSGEITSMEALVRWDHPQKGIIHPAQFIAVVEELALINQLGAAIIRQVCKDIRHCRDKGVVMPRIAINVSPRQFQDSLFTQTLLDTLSELNVDPREITLEITESLLIQHDEAMGSTIKKIKALGFCLSMDDFGTGYSALQYLKHYPFDYVKIDRSFVKNMMDNTGDAAIANAVIAMSHSMGLKVIAEGVETEAQCAYLSRNMCDQIQGYFLSQPMPIEQAANYIATQFTLPKHLLRMTKVSQTLLLVDDEPNILAALKRLFRQDGYKILTADSGAAGLEVLKENQVDVIMSDQRMPSMTGVEFLRHAKEKYPDTMRLVLSGYTELQSITDAINEGAIYKFLTKPWDDQQIRDQISDAFTQKQMSDENRKLGLKIQTANQELASANRQLAEILDSKEKQLYRDETSLDIAREALLHIPIPMLGIDDDGMIAFANLASEKMLSQNTAMLGAHIDEILPGFFRAAAESSEGNCFSLPIQNFNYSANWRTMGTISKSRGKLITFFDDGK